MHFGFGKEEILCIICKLAPKEASSIGILKGNSELCFFYSLFSYKELSLKDTWKSQTVFLIGNAKVYTSIFHQAQCQSILVLNILPRESRKDNLSDVRSTVFCMGMKENSQFLPWVPKNSYFIHLI